MSNAHTYEITLANFETDVVKASLDTPVLVDFWAPWCGPCKTLVPILEGLAAEYNGAFRLAKVNIDDNPQLAEAFRIQSVPAVILVKGGEPVDGFMGALPMPEVREFLEKHVQGTSDPLQEAEQLAANSPEAAVEFLLQAVVDHPEREDLKIALAQYLIDLERFDEAQAQLDQLSEEARETDGAKALAARLQAQGSLGNLDDLRKAAEGNADDLSAQIEFGKAQVAAQEVEEGMERLLDVAKRDLRFEDGAPRKALIEMFELLGPEDPHTLEFQQRLSILLC